MSINARGLRNSRLVAVGVAMALTVSLATAAIVMLVPDSPVYLGSTRTDQVAQNMSEYVQLHQGRHTVVPSHMRIDVDVSAQ